MKKPTFAVLGLVVALGAPSTWACFSCEGIPVPSTYHRTVANTGNWSSSSTWQGGSLPAAGHNILVPAGKTLTVDINSTTLYGTIVVEGTLKFRTSANTKLHCDTILVAENAGFDIGASNARVPASTTVEIVFDGGNLSVAHDPKLVTRGLVSEGRVGIWGSNKTAFRSLATTSGASGTSTITLSSAPTGWRVGDQIVITGVTFRPRPTAPKPSPPTTKSAPSTPSAATA